MKNTQKAGDKTREKPECQAIYSLFGMRSADLLCRNCENEVTHEKPECQVNDSWNEEVWSVLGGIEADLRRCTHRKLR